MLNQINGDLRVTGQFTPGEFNAPAGCIGNAAAVQSSTDPFSYEKLEQLHAYTHAQHGRPARGRARSATFDLDNGAAATIDDVVMKLGVAANLQAARIVYVEETTGTVAAANVKLGTTLGGAEVAAATAYGDAAAVGTSTALVLVDTTIDADQAVFARHTGIAATAAGKAYVELEYTEGAADNREVYAETVALHGAFGASGDVVSIEATLQEGLPTSTKAHTIDLQYGTPATGYATVLTAPISLSSASVLRTAVAGALVGDPSYVDGGSFRLVIASSGSGTNGKGLSVTVRLAEKPLS